MAKALRRPVVMGGVTVPNDAVVELLESSPTRTTDADSFREMLRQRWELASVLNFLHVFEPVIESNLKISAEDIETALIEQNNMLAQLHIALLKGIISKNKPLKSSDDWILTLSKTLSVWWPWVATGEFPLTGAKGEEISIYKKLEPTTRLLILKALCEVRADQYDAVSYINESMKENEEVFNFQKNKFAGNGNGIAFWYDGNETIGHRLYKEVQSFENEGVKGQGIESAICCKWETLATNFEEFKKIVSDYSSSRVQWEVALSKSLETDVIPVLEKQWKKKQKAQQRQQREQMLLQGLRSSRLTRSCRNQKLIDYRFDNFDKSIAEAIQYTNKRNIKENKSSQPAKRRVTTSSESKSCDDTSTNGESTESDAEKNTHKAIADSNNSSHDEFDDDKNDGNRDDKKVQKMKIVNRPRGTRISERLAGVPAHTVSEGINLGAKNRLRQRPSVNTALESAVVPDSEDESSPGGTSEVS
ncbi:hypothetical protein CASFOL_007246 [Castilleja foliolosa]|uniref:DDT domain-containing protein n=1 Tax=Castilleja foliolosa TaxID=1961234 RepID=A0ABD3E8Q7_9LAMI